MEILNKLHGTFFLIEINDSLNYFLESFDKLSLKKIIFYKKPESLTHTFIHKSYITLTLTNNTYLILDSFQNHTIVFQC